MRRLLIVATVGLLAAGGTAMALGWRTPAQAWSGIRLQSLSGRWAAIRGHSFAAAWTSIRRHAFDAWIAVRRHTPFDQPDAEASLVPSPKPVREANAVAHGTHRRSKGHPGKRQGD